MHPGEGGSRALQPSTSDTCPREEKPTWVVDLHAPPSLRCRTAFAACGPYRGPLDSSPRAAAVSRCGFFPFLAGLPKAVAHCTCFRSTAASSFTPSGEAEHRARLHGGGRGARVRAAVNLAVAIVHTGSAHGWPRRNWRPAAARSGAKKR